MTHRLHSELMSLLKSDSSIFNFIEQSCLDGIWYWDLEQPEHEWMSPSFWRTLGYEPLEKQHLTSEWQDIIHPDDLAVAIENFKKHCEDANYPYNQIVRYKHKQGHTVWVRCAGMAIRDDNGKPVRMLGAHTDVTELKNSELDLKKAMESRNRFFARMSHEIRTPLHGIIGLTDILQRKNTNQNLNGEIQTIAQCGEQLLSLLDDLLTLSDLQNKPLNIDVGETEVFGIMSYVANLYSARAAVKGLDFRLTLPEHIDSLYIKSDKVRLIQILSNLLNNAIKFTEHGFVELSAERIQSSNKLVISINDTGCGMSSDLLNPTDDSSLNLSFTDEFGSGLGLEIVRGLCKELNHGFNIESQIAKGTEVTVECEVIELDHSSSESPTQKRTASSAKFGSVLVVDDNRVNQDIVKIMLLDETEFIDTANDGDEAVHKALNEKEFDLILMDLNMPNKDGYLAATEILASTHLKKKPIIVAVSADAYPETIKKCNSTGMSLHIKKPFTKSKLIEALERIEHLH